MRGRTAGRDRRRRATAHRIAPQPDEHRVSDLGDLQASVGNRAIGGLLGAVQRDPDDAAASGSAAATSTEGGLASLLGQGVTYLIELATMSPTLLAPIITAGWVTDAMRIQVIESMLQEPLDATSKESMRLVWSSFGLSRLPRVIADHSTLWERCNAAGAELPSAWVGAGAGDVTTSVYEQVGANTYLVQGEYAFRVTADALTIEVGMDFKPDAGVAVPTATWFGYIASTWNQYDAVNLDDPTQRKRIDFHPVEGAGHAIQVSAGTGRANAAHYYLGDDRAAQTVPHEFGHLIGLEDEYERDAADYERITETVVPAEDGDGDGAACAAELHDALTLAKGDEEDEAAAVQRRQQAAEAVLTNHHIAAWYQHGVTAFTHEVAAKYEEQFGHEISADVMAFICYTSAAEPPELRDWRERVAGTFQYTSDSIMGDMSDHSHPVEPRHLRGFLGPLSQVYGGRWQPVPRG